MQASQNFELDQLASQAAAADAESLPAADQSTDGTEIDATPDYAHEANGCVDFFAALITGYCPKAEPIWTDKTKARVSAALAPVFEKYSFTMSAAPPELILLIIAGPPLFQSARLIAAQLQAERAAQPKAKPPADDQAPKPEVHDQVRLYQ